jgi:putative ABC transport system substrate-binding protein
MAIGIGRRQFISALGGVGLVWPRAVRAGGSNVPRVGYLFPFANAQAEDLWQACRQGLRDLGYREEQNVILEPRWAEEQYDRLSGLVAELLRIKVDVIVAAATPASRAAKAATNTTPIVFVAVADPVGIGLVATLARPGGNVTGLSLMTSDLSGKRLALLKEIVPNLSRLAILMNPDNPSGATFLADTERAARQLGIKLQTLNARSADEIERAFAVDTGHRADALVVFDDPVLWGHRVQIVALAAARKIPAMYGFRHFVVDGGLISYGPNREDQYRRTAIYVDKILKGVAPGDLPVEQPVKFQLVINKKTAKTLGLTVPQTLLVAADEVIE